MARAAPRLFEVRELLRSTRPVYAQGVAMLEERLEDGGSPVYRSERQAELSQQLGQVVAILREGEPRSPRLLGCWGRGDWV